MERSSNLHPGSVRRSGPKPDRIARIGVAVVAAAALSLPLAGCKGDGEAEAAEAEAAPALAVSHLQATVHAVEATEPGLGVLHAARTPQLGAEVDGTIIRLVADEGTRVRRNDLLAIIDDATHQLAHRRAEAELRRIDVQMEEKAREISRLERMNEGGSAPRATLDAARAELDELEQERVVSETDFLMAERALARTRVVAPHDGVITARHISEGDQVSEGTVLFDLADHGSLEVRVALPEGLSDQLAEGQELRLWREGEEDSPRTATVDRISPSIDNDARSATVVAQVEDAPDTWRPGGTLRAELVLDTRASILLPPEAVVRRPAGLVVYAIEDGVAQAHEVETGLRHADWIEIRSGLLPGMEIAVDGAGFLSDGAAVEASPRDWSPQAGAD